jgi:hypothetical protein
MITYLNNLITFFKNSSTLSPDCNVELQNVYKTLQILKDFLESRSFYSVSYEFISYITKALKILKRYDSMEPYVFEHEEGVYVEYAFYLNFNIEAAIKQEKN